MHLLSFLLTATLVNSACKSSVTCSLPWSPTMCSGYDVGSKVCYLADFDLHHYEYSCYDTAKCRNPSLAPSDPSSGWSQIDMCEGECSFPLCPSDIEAVGSGTWSHVPLNIHWLLPPMRIQAFMCQILLWTITLCLLVMSQPKQATWAT